MRFHVLSWTDVHCCVSQAAVAWCRRTSLIVQECVDNVRCITSHLKYLSLASLYLPLSLLLSLFHSNCDMSHVFILLPFFFLKSWKVSPMTHFWLEYLNAHLWNLYNVMIFSCLPDSSLTHTLCSCLITESHLCDWVSEREGVVSTWN